MSDEEDENVEVIREVTWKTRMVQLFLVILWVALIGLSLYLTVSNTPIQNPLWAIFTSLTLLSGGFTWTHYRYQISNITVREKEEEIEEE